MVFVSSTVLLMNGPTASFLVTLQGESRDYQDQGWGSLSREAQ